MHTAKHDALAAIAAMPDDVRIEDIQHRLYVLDQIREGLDSAETEGSLSNEEARARLSRWLAG